MAVVMTAPPDLEAIARMDCPQCYGRGEEQIGFTDQYRPCRWCSYVLPKLREAYRLGRVNADC